MPRGQKRKKKWHSKRDFGVSNRCWGAKRSHVRSHCTQIQIIGFFWGLALIHDYPEEGAILLRQRHTTIPEGLLSKFRFTESSMMCRFGPGLGFGTHKNLCLVSFFGFASIPSVCLILSDFWFLISGYSTFYMPPLRRVQPTFLSSPLCSQTIIIILVKGHSLLC